MLVELSTVWTPWLVAAVEEGPEPEDVVAGWGAFALFGLLILAVVFLGFSLTKRLKNAARSEAEGRYDPSTKKTAPKPPLAEE